MQSNSTEKSENNYLVLMHSKHAPKGMSVLAIKKDVADEEFDCIKTFLDENLDRVKSDVRQWYIKTSDFDNICNAIDEYLEAELESESDDELIQEALARRLKSEAIDEKDKEIMDETIENSDDEDVKTLSKRLRHLYKVIGELRVKGEK